MTHQDLIIQLAVCLGALKALKPDHNASISSLIVDTEALLADVTDYPESGFTHDFGSFGGYPCHKCGVRPDVRPQPPCVPNRSEKVRAK
jgi:hypothetical protein